ncbi:MAG: hypothetical protein LBT84_01985 [Spirochaetia bacterium]|jgi:hypothetical protein|nr:hypothetical protein [Spirochaetia bacterium]
MKKMGKEIFSVNGVYWFYDDETEKIFKVNLEEDKNPDSDVFKAIIRLYKDKAEKKD